MLQLWTSLSEPAELQPLRSSSGGNQQACIQIRTLQTPFTHHQPCLLSSPQLNDPKLSGEEGESTWRAGNRPEWRSDTVIPIKDERQREMKILILKRCPGCTFDSAPVSLAVFSWLESFISTIVVKMSQILRSREIKGENPWEQDRAFTKGGFLVRRFDAESLVSMAAVGVWSGVWTCINFALQLIRRVELSGIYRPSFGQSHRRGQALWK